VGGLSTPEKGGNEGCNAGKGGVHRGGREAGKRKKKKTGSTGEKNVHFHNQVGSINNRGNTRAESEGGSRGGGK